jgi:SP family facilitated glucose transporter-like MFS transporter 3
VVPITLAEMAPPDIRGSVGVYNQVGTVFGILSTQALGMNYNAPREWRTVLTASSLLSLVALLIGWVMDESPVYLKNHGRAEEAQRVAAKIWKHGMPLQNEGETADPLLPEGASASNQEEGYANNSAGHSVGVREVLKSGQYRRPLLIVSLVMVAQQISGKNRHRLFGRASCPAGINAVMYYSTNILSKLTPASASWISLIVAIVNALMTFPAISLIEVMCLMECSIGY